MRRRSQRINGDDALELFYDASSGFTGLETVVDVFGEITYTSGTGASQPWNHLDGWAKRKTSTGPDGTTFTIANWELSGMNATDGCTTNALFFCVFSI